jgi:hypothetical protein
MNLGNNKSSVDPDKNETFWEHSQNDNFKEMQNSCRQYGPGEYFDPVPSTNNDKTESTAENDYNQNSSNVRSNGPAESTIPPEMGGTEDSGQGILP